MNIYLEALLTTLTPQVVASLLGGLFGTLLQVNKKVAKYGVVTMACLGLGGVITAAAASEYISNYLEVQLVFLHSLAGYIVGLLAVSALDAVSELAPNQMSAIVNGTGETALELIKARLRLWLNVSENKDNNKNEKSDSK